MGNGEREERPVLVVGDSPRSQLRTAALLAAMDALAPGVLAAVLPRQREQRDGKSQSDVEQIERAKAKRERKRKRALALLNERGRG